MAEFSLDDARILAGSLVTIGHPYSQVAIYATASDLVRWCKGAFVDGRPVSPAQQAEALIERARTTWDAWGDGGTKRLLELFREMYPPKAEPKQEWTPLSYEATLAKGLIKPPCDDCDDRGFVGKPPDVAFCSCWSGRYQKRYEGERGLQRLNTSPTPPRSGTPLFTPITEQRMQRALDDEWTRKQKQLKSLGVD